MCIDVYLHVRLCAGVKPLETGVTDSCELLCAGN